MEVNSGVALVSSQNFASVKPAEVREVFNIDFIYLWPYKCLVGTQWCYTHRFL